ncbi:MAG: hypothetical protein KA149_11390 [Chitinophagales bacterium]|nr:hypothetical protein [Chitinophagales bacterium]
MENTSNRYLDGFLFAFIFVSLTLLMYGVFSYIDYSSIFFGAARALSMLANYFFFLVLCRHVYTLNLVSEKLNQYPSIKNAGASFIGFCLTVIHLVITLYTTETLNDWLLIRNNRQTTATVKDCVKSKGSEYCVYVYFVNGTGYQVKYHNDEPGYKFKEYEDIQILYYPPNPIVSKIKGR